MTARTRILTLVVLGALLVSAVASVAAAAAPSVAAAPPSAPTGPQPKFSAPAAFDKSAPLSDLASSARSPRRVIEEVKEIRPDRGPSPSDQGHTGDGALQGVSPANAATIAAIPSTLVNFEGLSNQDNFKIFGGRVNPPDPVGDVGPNHYVEMVNLVYGIYDKQGNLLLGPVDTGTLWAGFPIEDCTDPSGDPIVVYDQLADRWLLSQFTTRGLDDPTLPFYDCVAISTTGDPTGTYYRYAFITQPDTVDGGYFFPDYPKYGVWTDSYLMTTRDFGLVNQYGISVYALEKNKMLNGDPNARAVQFFLNSAVVPINLIGDGLLPPDIDGKTKPRGDAPAPIVGTQDDGGPYGATFDALNIWHLDVKWRATPTASLTLSAQLPVASFDSIFPCRPTSRDCLPQPGITNPNQYLDILSYRQRPTWRLAYRNFGTYEALVTNQSVEALPGVAGVRWYEMRRTNGSYSLYQQGT